MNRSRIQHAVTVSLALLLLAALSTPASAAADPGAVLEGTVDAAALRWTAGADGAVTPRLPDTRPLLETGKPDLPGRDLTLIVPADLPITGVEIVPLGSHDEPVPGTLATAAALETSEGIAVAQGHLPLSGDVWPAAWGEMTGDHAWRGFRLVTVRIFPVRAVRDGDGRWTSLRVLDRYRVRLTTGPGGRVPDMVERRRLVPGEHEKLERFLRPLVANPGALGSYRREDGVTVAEPAGGFSPDKTPTLSGSAVSYLIITNEMMAPAFQVLADRRTAQGYPAVVATVEWIEANFRHGFDIQETIRLFIREAYENWGVQWVLLGGDTDVIPARYDHSTFFPPGESTDIPADIYFACLDGNWNADGDDYLGESYINASDTGDDADLADEVYLGRAPVNTLAEAVTFVDKAAAYEDQPSTAAWTDRFLFAAELLFETPYLDGATFCEAVDTLITNCTDMESVRMYEKYMDWPGSVPLTRSALIDSLNSGRYSYLDQVGHGFFFNMSVGDANFVNADADALVNGDHNFLIYALNCASCAFDNSCLMERFILNPDGGSVASIGSSREAFPYTAHNFHHEFFEMLLCGEAAHMGELVSLSRLPFLGVTWYNSYERWTYMNYTLLGDPAMRLWRGTPLPLDVTAPSGIATGTQNVVVTVTSGGAPVDSALVCLSKDGDDYVTGRTNASGQVGLSFTAVRSGTAVLTVSGKDLELTRRDIPVTVGSAYVAVTGLAIQDDGAAGTSGNGNGVAEAGETVALRPECEDTGGAGATGCTGILLSAPSGVTVLDPNADIGDVPPGGTKTATSPFLVQLDPGLTDGFLADLTIVVVDDTYKTYQNSATVTVRAPEPEPVRLEWSDTLFGDNDGIIDDGERIDFWLSLKNFGVGRADTITGVLRTDDHEVTIQDSVVTWIGLDLLETSAGGGYFSLTYASTPSERWARVDLTDNHGRVLRHDFRILPPGVPQDLVSETSQGPDVIALHWTPVADAGMRGYHVYRSESAGGPFLRADIDLLEGTSYFRDDGLAPMTQYFYRVTAVDSSLVEGDPSTIISRSTAPPELTGFPLPFAIETSSHCAVGDVDGDGRLNIVLGADEIYVWNPDGTELFDGDDDAQTYGPITNLDANFATAGITLAELDGRPGLEIIASDKDSKQIYIFRGDGSILPGWPQHLGTLANSWNWGCPVVGDVDGDGDMEIVVNALDSRTWVWHADGTELLDGDGDPATNGLFLDRGIHDEWGFTTPALYDVDHDGGADIIFGARGISSGARIRAYRYDGSIPAGYPLDIGWGEVNTSPAIADLNHDGLAEIILNTQADSLFVYSEDGTVYPGFPVIYVANKNTIPGPSPAVGNMDDDPDLEIVMANNIDGLNGDLAIFDTDVAGGTSGQMLPGWPVHVPGSSEGSPVVGDITGDGRPDIIYGIGGGNVASPNNLYAFEADGTPIDGFPVTVEGPLRPSPVLCDLDGDGDIDIVHGGWDMKIHVWDMPAAWNPAAVPWRTFHGHFYRDGVFREPGETVPVGDPAPTRLALGAPYPNPFNPTVTVPLFVPGRDGATRALRLGVYDLRGRLVRTLHDGSVAAGRRTFVWDGRDDAGRPQASGVYFVQARSGSWREIRKVSLVK